MRAPIFCSSVERAAMSTTRRPTQRLRQVDSKVEPSTPFGGYDLRMPRRQGPRFDRKSIGKEVEAARVRLNIPVDDIWPKIGLSSRTHWYSKTDGKRPFTWEQVGQLAVEFQAPKGWPVVPWDEGLAWEAHLAGRE